jgi:1-acyl-sn-glycerol-3-phosphate acyltransferase
LLDLERSPTVNTMTRLVLLWLSQAARVMADGCLRLVAMLEATGAGERGRLSAFQLSMVLFILPFVLLAPLNGCVSNALPRRWVLAGSAAFSLVAIVVFAALGGPWLACVVVVGVGAALNSSARYAILPAAARDARLPLPRVSGWIELGAAVAVVASVALGLALPEPGWPGNGEPLARQAVLVLVGLNALCLLGALPAWFPSDLRRPEPAGAAIRGFFRDLGRITRERVAGSTLLALAGFQGLVTAAAGPLVTDALQPGASGLTEMVTVVVLAGVGVALGSATASLVGHPRRCLGLVPLGAAGLVGSLVWALLVITPDAGVPRIPCLLLGFTTGLINAPLRAAYLAAIPSDARGNGTAVMNTAIYLMTALLAGLVIALTYAGLLTSSLAQLAFLTVLGALGATAVWCYLFPPLMELVSAWVMLPQYRIRGHGPGLDHIPATGPLLVIANHAAYVDPFWIGKVMPRKITPMMTSVFYDRLLLRWLMRWVVGAIRVESSGFRREAPELAEAVAVLRCGGCVLIFPEGMMRRKEELLLRQFGQGVWHILREVPDTPVLVCWIEGGWGSYASYHGGRPFTNKRPDWRRPINVVVAEPAVLPPEVLADHRATRQYLMKACLDCRRHLGLAEADGRSQMEECPLEEGASA